MPAISDYETELSPSDEQQFQKWKLQYAPNDSGEDYDLRGAFKAGLKPSSNGHWPDTYKKPNHPTFSNESIYAKDAPSKAGHWIGETYVSPNKADVLSAVRQKYPQYTDTPDGELVIAIGKKYPVYRQKDKAFDELYRTALVSKNPPKLNPLEQAIMGGAGKPGGAPLPSYYGIPPEMDPEKQGLIDIGKAAIELPPKVIGKAIDTAESPIRKVFDLPVWLHNAYVDYQQKHGRDLFADKRQTVEQTEKESPNGAVFQFPRSEGKGAVAGIENLASSTAQKFLGRPEDIVMLGLVPGEGALGTAAKGLFGAQALAGIPESTMNALRVLQDPKATTAQKIEASGDPIIQSLFAKMLVGEKKGVSPGETLKSEVSKLSTPVAKPLATIGEFPSAKVLDTIGRGESMEDLPNAPKGAIPTQFPSQGLSFKGISDEMVRDKRPKPVVPATEPEEERGISVVEEIRNNGAKTVADIQRLFPQAQLTREAARALRNAAWGMPQTPLEPSAAPKPPQTPPIAPQSNVAHGVFPQSVKWTDLGRPYISDVQIRKPDGSVVTGDFRGYQDYRAVGGGIRPMVGYPTETGMSHGGLKTGDTIVSKVPTPEEWKQIEENKAAQPKATQPSPSPVASPSGTVSSAAPKVPTKEATIVEPTVKKPDTQRELELSRGPGAAAAGEPGTYSPVQQMADRLRTTAKASDPIDAQINLIQRAKETGARVKDALSNAMAKSVAVRDAIWQKWKGLPEYGDEQRAVGKWFRATQQADHEAHNFAKEIVREVPDKTRREAITNWIQADGDNSVLQQRAEASKPQFRRAYEVAQKLTPREIEIAQMLREYYDIQLQRGLQEGILKHGLENYITQVWKKENPITKKLISELSGSKLQPNFKYARQRLFDSYFEGEQAGYSPNKDAGFLVANYDQSFNKSLAARAFIKDLHEGKASDGRPLVEISGNGQLIGDPNDQSVIINPKSKPEDISDYRTIDHPALRGWKWATKTPEGKNVFVKGDMLVHPEAYQKLKNRLSVSAFRQNPISRAILGAQTSLKQTMLSVSGFHQVQETLHALGHRVNPLNLPEIDFSEPTTKALAEHGLQLADYDALSAFSEGLSGSGLLGKVPGIGPKLHAYNEWLFQDYIPRLKLQMAKLALERNRERYSELNEDKLLEQTARQANAAFGELPYRYWGRSPTLQDALRTFILAPDFLEARTRFVGRAVRPFGREQLIALGLLAGTQYITARIVNEILDKDPHWELKNAFRIVAGKHAYGLRSIPSDMLHLFTDTRGFFYNRMSPMLRTAVTAITGRDEKGVKRDLMEQAKDALKMPIPISVKPRAGERWWETFLNSLGVQEQRWDASQTIQQKVSDFKKKRGITDPYETIYNQEADKFAAVRNALQNGNATEIKSELDKLEKAGTTKAQIYKHFNLSLGRPLTGSRANDLAFENSLDATGKEELKEAKDLNAARLEMLQEVLAGTTDTRQEQATGNR